MERTASTDRLSKDGDTSRVSLSDWLLLSYDANEAIKSEDNECKRFKSKGLMRLQSYIILKSLKRARGNGGVDGRILPRHLKSAGGQASR
jgi:hypothetical protein